MSHSESQLARTQSETQLLQFLCHGNASPFERGKLAQMLNSYRWSAPDNAILFECICELLARAPRRIPEHLPAALTRRGFPEISCDSLAGSSQIKTAEALAVARKLLGASH